LLKIKDIQDQLKSIDKTMEEEDMMVITWKVCLLHMQILLKPWTFEQLSNKLLQQDKWKKQFGNSSVNESSEVALAAKFKSRGSKQREENDGDNSSKSGKSRKAIKCFYFGKLGHISRGCGMKSMAKSILLIIILKRNMLT
jgi:hypothetical protein